MQKIVFEKPYRFVPPLHTNAWPALIQIYLPRYLRKKHGITSVECRHSERLKASLDAGHAIVLAPNHCRVSDPLVLGPLVRPLKTNLFALASWHLFNQDWFTTFMIRRTGAFSLYREGTDRQAINAAVEILERTERPLVVFPEGATSRHNDKLMPLLDGVAFVARSAAKRRAKLNPPGKVIVHPVAIRYFFRGNLQESLDPVLSEFEARLSWQPQQHHSLIRRIRRIAEALLSLKEIEYLGEAREGGMLERVAALIEEVLQPLEAEWGTSDRSGTATHRARRLRSAILPEMQAGKVDEEERARRWRQLSAIYYAQQMSHYLESFIELDDVVPEHVLEVVERFEEDITDRVRVHGPMHVVIEVGEAIEVSPERDRGAAVDPLMQGIEDQLNSMLAKLAAESPRLSLRDAARPSNNGQASTHAMSPSHRQ